PAPLTRAYGDANPTVTYAHFTFTGLISAAHDALFGTITPDFGAVATNTATGTYAVTATIGDTTNYHVTNTPAGDLVIGKRNVTAAFAAPLTRAFSASNPTIDYSSFIFTGLISAAHDALFTNVTPDFSAVAGSGVYNITATIGDTTNYHIANTPATTLTVGAGPVTSLPSTVTWVSSQNEIIPYLPPPGPARLFFMPSADDNGFRIAIDERGRSERPAVQMARLSLSTLRGLLEIDPRLAREIDIPEELAERKAYSLN
ncbi:MAG TPA: hypothetical protein DHV85_01770, partial [Candidatus Accumulibacter sp.]|nr:hypothetical protein [Accumulibacter sp.]